MARTTDTREHIIEATARIIAEEGPARATTKEIARVAACAEGSIYRYFPSKADLFLEVYRRWSPEFVQLVAALPERAGKGTVRATLQELAASALAFYREKAPRIGVLLSDPQLLREHRRLHPTSRLGPRKALEHVAEYLRAEQQLGRVNRGTRPRVAARLLLGACFQEATWSVILNDADQTRQARLPMDIANELIRGLEPRRREEAG